MDALQQIPFTMCMQKSTVVATGAATTIASTGTFHFAIKGKAYSHAALSGTATATTDAVTGLAFNPVTANNGCVFVIGVDAAGNVKQCQGPIQALDATGKFIIAPQFPAVPDTLCPIAYAVAVGISTLVGNWVWGTANMTGVTGMTVTFVDLITLPDRPQVS
jgi:hypothetical protein